MNLFRSGKLLQGRQRGVALLMVLALLTLLGSVVADFQYNSHVDFQLAVNARDELQAEYNAMSALRLRALLLRQATKVQGALGTLFQAIGGAAGAVPPIGAVLEMIPVECGLMSMITRRVEASVEDDGEREDFFRGECLATSTSEHAKISLNMLGNHLQNRDQQVASLLLGLLSDPRLEEHFEEDDLMGDHAESPQELVGAITDWVDADHTQAVSTVVDEDRHYDMLRDSYKAKNAPFDSLEELQLVHGVDDALFAILRDHVTIYNDSTQIELGTASDYQIFLGLAASLRDNVGPEALFLGPGFLALRQGMLQMRALSGGMLSLKVGTLRELVREAGLDGVIDSRKLGQVFSDKSSTTWYTLSAQGRLGNASRRITAVFQASEGQFYYFRIE